MHKTCCNFFVSDFFLYLLYIVNKTYIVTSALWSSRNVASIFPSSGPVSICGPHPLFFFHVGVTLERAGWVPPLEKDYRLFV
jgi:hypothetical protein